VGSCIAETDATTIPKPPWRQRKEQFIESLRQAPRDVRRIAAADKLHNVRSLIRDFRVHGDSIWESFNGGKDGTIWYYRQITRMLQEAGSRRLIEELGRAVTELETLVSGKN